MILFVDQAFCGITDAQIKAASKTFISTMKDWMPAIIGGGLIGSGICLFANNFKMGIAGLAGTGFPDKNLVRVEGKLNNYVGSKRIKDSQETYEVTFRTYRG